MSADIYLPDGERLIWTDMRARPIRFAGGVVAAETAQLVCARIGALITI